MNEIFKNAAILSVGGHRHHRKTLPQFLDGLMMEAVGLHLLAAHQPMQGRIPITGLMSNKILSRLKYA